MSAKIKVQNKSSKSRRSIRLAGYDYSQAGAYFVTICAQEEENVFGEIANGEMALNDTGKMVENNWNKLPQRFPNVALDEFVIMPNHIHGVIAIGAPIVGAQNGDVVGARDNYCGVDAMPDDRATTRVAPTLGGIIGAFKSITTNEYIRNVKNKNRPPFNKHFWQRNYYEHVIRDENDLNRIREYIVNNPAKWFEDEYYAKTKT